MRKIICLLIFIIVFINAGSQTLPSSKIELPQVVLPTPQSQIFEKYLKHQVSDYNGLSEISIPLYEIEIKGLKIPISLSYHSSGIKYGQFDGDTGAGWSINAGGYRVNRTVYGQPDEKYDLYAQAELDAKLATAGGTYKDRLNRDRYLLGLVRSRFYPFVTTIQDSQYDHFTYMLPTSSGNFVILDRKNKTVEIAEQNGDKIILDENKTLCLNDMKIIDGNGFTYLLGGGQTNPNVSLIENTKSLNTPELDNTVGWPLKQIQSPYNQFVHFKYKHYEQQFENRYGGSFSISDAPFFKEANVNIVGQFHNAEGTVSTPKTKIDQLYINSITTDKEIITFQREGYSISGISIDYIVSGIEIKTKDGELIKRIQFNYKKVPEGAVTNYNEPWHLLLTSITIGNGSVAEKKYSFEYNEPTSKELSSTYADQWGYYKNSREGMPEGRISEGGIFLHKEFKNDPFIATNTFNAVNISNFKYIWRGAYMSSGSYNIVDRSSNNSAALHYFSLKKIKYPTGRTTEYKYEPNQFVQYNGSTVYGSGQRIQKIISYLSNEAPSIVSEYKYGMNNDGNGLYPGKILKVPEFFASKTLQIFSTPNIDVDGKQRGYAFNKFNVVRDYSTTPYLSDFSNMLIVSYPEICTLEYDVALGKYNGKIITKYNIPSNIECGTVIPSYNYINGYPANGGFEGNSYIQKYNIGLKPSLHQRLFFDNNNTLIKKELIEYDTIVTKTINSVYVTQKVFTPNINLENYNFETYGDFHNPYKFTNSLCAVGKIEVQLHNMRIRSKNTVDYNLKDSIILNESYTYNDRNQLSVLNRKDKQNGNVLLTTTYKYPADYAGGIHQKMLSKNYINPIIEEIETRNNKEINRKKVIYSDESSRTKGSILPVYVQTSTFGINNLRTDLTYDLYDNKGNIRQITTIDGISTVYLWSYNGQYPIAEIKNTTFAEAETAAKTVFSVAGVDALSALTTPNEAKLKDGSLQKALPNAHITTYTYKPLVGILTATDPAGLTTTYEYDTFGRLIRIKDPAGKIIQSYNYHYQNQ